MLYQAAQPDKCNFCIQCGAGKIILFLELGNPGSSQAAALLKQYRVQSLVLGKHIREMGLPGSQATEPYSGLG